jgi:capsular polysaccharide biosynthesis protein
VGQRTLREFFSSSRGAIPLRDQGLSVSHSALAAMRRILRRIEPSPPYRPPTPLPFPLSIKSIALHSLRLGHSLAGYLPSVGRFRPLRGSFSAYQRLRDGKIEGTILSDHQEPGTCPPGSMTERAAFQQHDHQPWPIFWTMSTDARLVGRMLHWRDEKDRICSEGVYHLPSRRQLSEDKWSAQILVPDPMPLPGAWTSLLSNWNDGYNYFHWLLDGLTRLAVREKIPEVTKILIPASPSGFVTETMRLLNLEHHVVPAPAECIRPERFYFCSPTAMTGVWNPVGYQWLREKFSPHYAEPNSGSPVFLTRRGASRLPENLVEIEALFTSQGYHIIDCGALSVLEQIQALSGATAIAGLHGAAMTNLLWARPGTPVLEIFQPAYLNACYEQLAFQGGLDYKHLVLEGENPLSGINRWLAGNR